MRKHKVFGRLSYLPFGECSLPARLTAGGLFFPDRDSPKGQTRKITAHTRYGAAVFGVWSV